MLLSELTADVFTGVFSKNNSEILHHLSGLIRGMISDFAFRCIKATENNGYTPFLLIQVYKRQVLIKTYTIYSF